MKLSPTSQGQLLVWTGIDPEHEADFNAWYDREHMEERVAIPGMLWARRYRAQSDTARRYLAIYRTESLGTFTSEPYRTAFTQQTDWSNRNFARMTDTQRRVMAVSAEAGFGAGCALALVELAGEAPLPPSALDGIAGGAGVLRIQLLTPDPGLSTPLPSETASPRILRPVLLIDATSRKGAAELCVALAAELGPLAHSAQPFDLIWSLDAADLSARRRA